MALSGGAALIPVKPLVTPGQFTSSGQKAGQEFSDGFHRDANGRLRRANGQFANDAEIAAHGGGKRAGKRFGSGFASSFKGMVAPLVGGLAFGALIKSSVQIRAEFEKTLNTLGAVAGVQGKRLKGLEKLAIQMGNSTVFSANEAAAAMLELAKGGIAEADIRAGALRGTLLLAAAGGTDLATAAGIASNAMNTFGLKGRDMNRVANALAGGANASTASVESLGQALSQVGPGARNAGLDINETVGALAAFDSAGIKGSDAGTSLKTMLARLVPQTDAAEGAMKKLGLNFVKRNGDFQSLGNIAQQLQDKLGGLSQSERSRALTTIFGSDATRAATVLMNEGAKGLGKYVRATKDQKAAQGAANAAMKGLPGALERLSGAWETFRLQIGKALAPGVIAGANVLADTMGGLVPFVQRNVDTFKILGQILVVGATVWAGYALGVKLSTIWTALHTAGTIRATIAQTLLNRAMMLNPIGLVVGALVALGVGLVIAYKKSETFRRIVDGAWAGIRKAVSFAWHGVIRPALSAFAGFFGKYLMPAIRGLGRGVQTYFRIVWGVIKFAWQNVIRPIFQVWRWYITNVVIPAVKWLWTRGVRPTFDSLKDKIVTVWRKFLRPTLGALRDFVVDKLAPAVARGIGKIKDVWSTLASAAKKPVRFLVNTVYNSGIREMIGKLPGVKTPDKVKLGFRDGGYTGRVDPRKIVGPVHGDEHVIRSRSRRKIERDHPGLLDHMNQHGRLPRPAGFFLGGRVPLPGATSISRHSGYPWATWAGDLNKPGDNGAPVVAWADGQVASVKSLLTSYGNHIKINHGAGRTLYAHLSGFNVNGGQKVKAGQMIGRVGSTGNSTGPHLHFELAGGSNAVTAGGGGAAAPAKVGGFAVTGWLGAIKDVVGIAKKVKGWMGELGGGGWAGIFRNMISGVGGSVVDWMNQKIPNRLLPDNPIPNVFDTGGRLPTGLSLAYNGTGRPETVLTDGQLRTLQAANQAGALPRSLRLVVDGYEFNAYVDARAEDTVTAAGEMAGMLGRAGA
ncbi:MAG: phage tail tape measure protein [Nocardioidaceae bacterium]